MTDKKETTSKLKDEVLEMVEAGASPQEIFDKHGEAIGNITDGIGTEEMMKRAMAGFSRMAKDNGIELGIRVTVQPDDGSVLCLPTFKIEGEECHPDAMDVDDLPEDVIISVHRTLAVLTQVAMTLMDKTAMDELSSEEVSEDV